MLHLIKEEESGEINKVSGVSGAFASGMLALDKMGGDKANKSVEVYKKALNENPSNEQSNEDKKDDDKQRSQNLENV